MTKKVCKQHKSRRLFIWAGALIGAVILTAGVLFMIQRVKISKFTAYTGSIRSVSWSSGGGMDGGYLDYTAENTEKGYVLITKEEREGVRGRVKKSRSKVDPMIFTELDELIDSYDARNWGDLPKSELIALDARAEHVWIRLSGAENIEFSSTDEFPGDGYQIIQGIKELLSRYCER